MEAKLHKPCNFIDFLKTPLTHEQIQQVFCPMCNDILYEPVICNGTCKITVCRNCAYSWKEKSPRCPRKCLEQWRFSLTRSAGVDLKCPYSNQCRISGAEELSKHLKNCGLMPPQIKVKVDLLKQNLCPKGHKLLLWIDAPSGYSTNCAMCQKVHHSRNYCPTCHQHYCIACRPVVCSQTQPPIDIDYVKHTSYLETRGAVCDICSFKPQPGGDIRIHKDQTCNVTICDYCFNLLPKSLPCRPPYSSYSECPKHHTLQMMPQAIIYQCSYCLSPKPCIKKCKVCSQVYCLECKKMEILEQRCSNKDKHFFRYEERTPKKGETFRCCHCNTPNPYKFYEDKLCNIKVCRECFQAARATELNVYNIRGRQDCKKCKQKEHQMCILAEKKVDECTDCERLVEIRYVCVQSMNDTAIKQTVCFKCDQQNLYIRCALGHPFYNLPKDTPRICCRCEKKSWQGVNCKECEYSLCESCYQSSKNKVDS